MSTYFLCPFASVLQYFTDTGIILSGGKVNTYLAGTSTPQATYTDSTGVTPNSNPIILGSNARLPNVSIWQPQGVSLKIIITDANNNQLGPTFDQIPGIGDPTPTTNALINPASGFGADLVANAMRSYDIISSVRAATAPSLSAGQTLIICVEGLATVNDSKGGLFYWNPTSSATDDGLNVIKPNSVVGNGRYLRLIQSVSSSFTGTFTGFTTVVTATVQYRIYNNVAYMFFSTTPPTGTSNTTSMTMTGLPSVLIPSQGRFLLCCVENNANLEQLAGLLIDNVGNCTFYLYSVATGQFSSVGFTASNAKGLPADWNVSYPIF